MEVFVILVGGMFIYYWLTSRKKSGKIGELPTGSIYLGEKKKYFKKIEKSICVEVEKRPFGDSFLLGTGAIQWCCKSGQKHFNPNEVVAIIE
jgi:hypothetical protein